MIEKEFDIVTMQSAFFLASLDIENKLEFAQGLISATEDVFNGDPMILPFPGTFEEYPAELPFLILKSKDNFYHCNVAKNRIDFFYKGRPKEKKSLDELWPEYKIVISNFSKFIKDSIKERVCRLGLIVTITKDLDESINALLIRNYLKPGIIENPYEIQLNIMNKLTYDQFNLNRWIKLRPLRRKEDLTKDYGFLIEVDINTVSEISYDFKKEQINSFFNFVHTHFVSEVPNYVLIKD